MFTRLRLTNFKAWKDSGDVALKPVTMLLGTNSSGKSTLVQSLLLLKQTVQAPDRTMHLNLGGDGIHDLFHFGRFDDVLCQAAEGVRQFSIGFDFHRAAGERVRTGQFKATYGQTAAGSVAIQTLDLHTAGRHFQALRRDKGAYALRVDGAAHARAKGVQYAPERSVAFSADAIAVLDQDGPVVEDLSLAIRHELEGISYLGPLRRRPERDYLWNKAQPGEVGVDGRSAIDALLASALLKGSAGQEMLHGVSSWLARMQVADRLELRQVQFIVETHSEHLFRRMQTLIARQQVGPDDAAMYFVERNGPTAQLRALALDGYGRVQNWPTGFFGDAMGETREQARLMLARQRSAQV